MSSSLKRLYIFTGKGGVGKTTLSLAFTRWLNEQGHQATYVTLSQQSMGDGDGPQERMPPGWHNVPHAHITLEESAQDYITKKLGSQLVAKWIVHTAFFRALVNMMPGFGYVISLGRILETLQDNAGKIFVLDAPASGHALTMMEATGNFREIFQAGLVFDDTEKMLKKLYDPGHTGVRIFTLPTTLALSEALELKGAIHQLAPLDARVFLNHSLVGWQEELSGAPAALLDKLRLEEEALAQHSADITAQLPYSTAVQADALYQDLRPHLQRLL